MNPTVHEKASKGFNRASDAYERGRPDYPKECLDFLKQHLGLKPGMKVVDLAAGTGKFTRLLAKSGADLTAVEPVEGMREKFQSLDSHTPILNGTAEAMPLRDATVDIVTVAQAFHWFHGPLALPEIHRVLKPHGKLVMIWNVRDDSKHWVAELGHLMDEFEGSTPRYKSMQWKHSFENSALFTPLQHHELPHLQSGTVETMVDRVSSVSYIAAMADHEREKILNRVRKHFQTHPDTRGQEVISMPYVTHIYWCEKV